MSSKKAKSGIKNRGPIRNSVLMADTHSAEGVPSLGEIGLNQFAPYLLNRIAAHWNATMQDALEDFDLNTTRMRTLAVLNISPSLTINELSVLTITEQSTMSRTLDAMEEKGLIRRMAHEKDMRIRKVCITEEGRAAFASFWPTMYKHFAHLFADVSEDEYAAFTATLHKMLNNIRRSKPTEIA